MSERNEGQLEHPNKPETRTPVDIDEHIRKSYVKPFFGTRQAADRRGGYQQRSPRNPIPETPQLASSSSHVIEDSPKTEIAAKGDERPLPEKALAECKAKDLEGLTEDQLHELLFRQSDYRDRSVDTLNLNLAARSRYRIQVEAPGDEDTSQSLEAIRARMLKYREPQVLVGEVLHSDDPKTYDTIPIQIPFIEDGDSFYIDFTLLPIINKQLAERGLPQLRGLGGAKDIIKRFWSKDPYTALDQHNYGGGALVSRAETLQGMLSKEVRDLQELGVDFDDIINAIRPVIAALRTSLALEKPKDAGLAFHVERVLRGPLVEFPNQPNRPIEGRIETDEEKLVPTIYEHICDSDPDITAETIQWRYSVIEVPFHNFRHSVLEHRLRHTSNKGWAIPLSEASLSLYENRIIEGYASPHYRISGPRTVWALQLGSPEVQSKAFALDWKNTTEALLGAEKEVNIARVNNVMNYIMEFFPRDISYWKEHGFSGYTLDGQAYDSLTSLVSALKERFKLSVPEPTDPLIRYPKMKDFEE